MARIRSIKPEFWTDGDVIAMSSFARLLFIGMWNFAMCDHGHVADDPVRLKLQILPMDAVDIDSLIEETIDRNRVERLRTTSGRSYLWVKRMSEHQRIEKRWQPRCYVCADQKPDDVIDTARDLAGPRGTSREARGTSREARGTSRNLHLGMGLVKGIKKNVAAPAPTPPHREDVEKLCQHLADLIQSNGSVRPTVTDDWRKQARLMIDKDGRTFDQAISLIEWSQASTFWRANIMSMPKLREQYDKIRLQSEAEKPKGPRTYGSPGERKGLY